MLKRIFFSFNCFILVLFFAVDVRLLALDLDINQAVQKVLEQKSEVVNARLDSEVFKNLYRKSYSPLFPTLNLGYRRSFGSNSYKNQRLTDRYANISVKQSLTAPFSKSYDVYLAKLQYDKARISSKDAELKKTVDVYEVYFLIQKLKEDIVVLESNLKLAKDYVKIANRRYRSGLIDKASKARSELLLLQLTDFESELKKDIVVAEQELFYQLGYKSEQETLSLKTNLPSEFQKLAFDEKGFIGSVKVDDTYSNSISKLDLKIAKASSQKSKLDLLPSLFAEYSYDHRVDRKDTQLRPAKESSASIGIEWDIPVAGGDYFAFLSAKKARDKAKNNLRDDALRFKRDIKRSLDELQQLKSHYLYLQKYSKSLEEIAAFSQRKFNRGLVDAFVVGQDIEKQFTVRQRLNSVRYNITQKVLELSLVISDKKVIQLLF